MVRLEPDLLSRTSLSSWQPALSRPLTHGVLWDNLGRVGLLLAEQEWSQASPSGAMAGSVDCLSGAHDGPPDHEQRGVGLGPDWPICFGSGAGDLGSEARREPGAPGTPSLAIADLQWIELRRWRSPGL